MTKNQKAVLTSLVLDTSYLIVDGNGNYFNNKIGPFFSFDSWKAGPNYYVILSKAQIDQIREHGLKTFNSPMFLNQGGKVEPDTPITDLDDILSVGMEKGDVYKADTAASLAQKIGVENIDAALAKAGLSKTDEYYAIKGASYVYSTCGGLDIDENMNVLRTDGTPIRNLFAVGNDSIGVLLESKKAYVTYGGAAHGWALTSGQIAGTKAAEVAEKEL